MKYVEEMDRLLNNKYYLVAERIEFVEQLISAHKSFIPDKIKRFPALFNHVTTSYEHYEGLINYLLLTCFDILGQPDEWMDYGSWLRSKSSIHEREKIMAISSSNVSVIELSKMLHDQYIAIYGVKNSFYRFMREILSDQQRKQLFKTISASTGFGEVSAKDGMVTFRNPDGAGLELTTFEKERLLYVLRNSFTHRCMSCHDGLDMYAFVEKIPHRGIVIYHEIYKGREIIYTVYDWPNVLLNIIKEILDINKDKMPYFILEKNGRL